MGSALLVGLFDVVRRRGTGVSLRWQEQLRAQGLETDVLGLNSASVPVPERLSKFVHLSVPQFYRLRMGVVIVPIYRTHVQIQSNNSQSD